MAGDGQQTNWVYTGIGCALVVTVGCGFLWLNRHVAAWEATLERIASRPAQPVRQQPAHTPDEGGNEDVAPWADALVQVLDEGFRTAEERADERNARLLSTLEQAFDQRLAVVEQQITEEQTAREHQGESILDEVLRVVGRQIEERAQAAEHEQARVSMTRSQIRTGLGGALEAYRGHMQSYPATADGGLMALLEPPPDEELALYWEGPYVESTVDLLDAWGNALSYSAKGTNNVGGYDLASAGPDGQFGTADDITNR